MPTISKYAIEQVSLLAKKSPEQKSLASDFLAFCKGEAEASATSTEMTTSQEIKALFMKIRSALDTEAQTPTEAESNTEAQNNTEAANESNNEDGKKETVDAVAILKQIENLTTDWKNHMPKDVDESIVNAETAVTCLLILTYLNENECIVNKEILLNTIHDIVKKYMDNMSSTIFKNKESNAEGDDKKEEKKENFKFSFEFLKNKANEFLKKHLKQFGSDDKEDDKDKKEEKNKKVGVNDDMFANIMTNAMTAIRANAEMHQQEDFVKKCIEAMFSLGSISPNTPTTAVTKLFLEAKNGEKDKSEAAKELTAIATDEVNINNLSLIEKAMETIACMVIEENIELDINAAAEAIETITINTPSIYKKSLILLCGFIIICNIKGISKNGVFKSLIKIAHECKGTISEGEDDEELKAPETIVPAVIKIIVLNDAPEELRQKVTQYDPEKWMKLALENIKSNISSMSNDDINSTFAMVRMLILDNKEQEALFTSFVKTMSEIEKKDIEKHVNALIPLYIEFAELNDLNDLQVQKGYEAITKIVLDNKDEKDANKLALVHLMKSRIHTTEYKFNYRHALKVVMDIYAATKDTTIYDGVLEKSIRYIGDSEDLYTEFFDCATDYLKTVKSKKNEKLPQVAAAWAFAGSGHKARYYVAFYRFLTQFLSGLGSGVAETNVVKEFYPSIATDFKTYYAEAFCRRSTEESQYVCDKDALKDLFDTLTPFLLKDKEKTPSHMIDLYKQVTYLVDLASIEVDPSKRAKFDKLYKGKEESGERSEKSKEGESKEVKEEVKAKE